MRIATKAQGCLVLAFLLLLSLSPAPAAPLADVPDWFVASIEAKTAGEGVWITDNAAYRDEDGGIEQYGIQWRPGLGGVSMTGRLYGLVAGEEVGTYWEFRVFWHPGLGEARIYQFAANGTVGIGSQQPVDERGIEIMEQTFYRPDGSDYRNRHLNRTVGDREEGESQDWVDGRWEPRRTYVWNRVR